MGTIPEVAIALFRTPPDRFVAERDALVKELRAQGRDDDAATVKALRKPTATVWALNQLAERESEALAALFETGRALRAAQSDAIAGSSSAAWWRQAPSGEPRWDASPPPPSRSSTRAGTAAPRNPTPSRSRWKPPRSIPTSAPSSRAAPSRSCRRRAGDMGFGGVPAMTALTGGAADAAAGGGPSRAEAARLRRDRDTARAAAERRRAAADRLAHQLAEQRDALERLTAQHAEAESAALEAELEAERAARTADDAGV